MLKLTYEFFFYIIIKNFLHIIISNKFFQLQIYYDNPNKSIKYHLMFERKIIGIIVVFIIMFDKNSNVNLLFILILLSIHNCKIEIYYNHSKNQNFKILIILCLKINFNY